MNIQHLAGAHVDYANVAVGFVDTLDRPLLGSGPIGRIDLDIRTVTRRATAYIKDEPGRRTRAKRIRAFWQLVDVLFGKGVDIVVRDRKNGALIRKRKGSAIGFGKRDHLLTSSARGRGQRIAVRGIDD